MLGRGCGYCFLPQAVAHDLVAETIRERLFSTKKDGSNYGKCQSIVAATANHVNRKIVGWGLQIKSTGGPGSVYRLVKL